MPLTSSRAKRLIANAEASPRVSEQEVEALRDACNNLQEESFASYRQSDHFVEEEGNEVWISTAPVDSSAKRDLRKEVSALKSLVKRISYRKA